MLSNMVNMDLVYDNGYLTGFGQIHISNSFILFYNTIRNGEWNVYCQSDDGHECSGTIYITENGVLNVRGRDPDRLIDLNDGRFYIQVAHLADIFSENIPYEL